jgi:hypothetical protein
LNAAKDKEIIPLQKAPTPLTRFLTVGQVITYSERQYQKTQIRYDRIKISGIVEYLNRYYAVIRDKKGVPYTFTATDVFTNDVIIEGRKKGRNPLAEVLGLSEEE